MFHVYSLPPTHMPNTTGNSDTAMETETPTAGSRESETSLRVVARVRFGEAKQPLLQLAREFGECGSICVGPRLDDQVDRGEQWHQASAGKLPQVAP